MSGVDLVTFLRARLDEWEAAAKAASERVGPEWRLDEYDPPDPFSDGIVGSIGHQVISSGDVLVAQGIHIALNDPAFVLADVAAKRRVMDEFGDAGEWLPANRDYDEPEYAYGRARTLHDVIKLLAAPFAQHPDFDPAWAVQ